MKNIYYAIISTLLVTFLLFTIYYNVDLFRENVIEGNVNQSTKKTRQISPVKTRAQAKAAAKPTRQGIRRKEQEVCIGNNCKQWTQNKDITTDQAPVTKMDDMLYSMHYDKA
jgi:hypothetical protein